MGGSLNVEKAVEPRYNNLIPLACHDLLIVVNLVFENPRSKLSSMQLKEIPCKKTLALVWLTLWDKKGAKLEFL